MEVLRVPPYPITTTWTLPIPNYEYIVYVEDLVDHSVTETNIFSDANGKLIYEIPLAQVQYDRKFFIKFYDTEHQHTLYEENLDIVRPYTDPAKLGTTASEIQEYKTLEMVARSIIDTIVVNGFYNSKHIVQRNGDGSDYFAIWEDINKVLKVYENNVLIYDVDQPELSPFEFKVTSMFAVFKFDCKFVTIASNEELVYGPHATPSTVKVAVIEVRFGIKFGETSFVDFFLYCVRSSPKLNVSVLLLKTIVWEYVFNAVIILSISPAGISATTKSSSIVKPTTGQSALSSQF